MCQQTLVHNLLCNLNGAGLLLLKQVPKGSLGPDQVSIFAGCDQELVYALWFHAMLTVSLRFHTLWVDFLGSDQVLAGSVGRDQVWALVFDQVWMDFPGSDKVLPGRNPVCQQSWVFHFLCNLNRKGSLLLKKVRTGSLVIDKV